MTTVYTSTHSKLRGEKRNLSVCVRELSHRSFHCCEFRQKNVGCNYTENLSVCAFFSVKFVFYVYFPSFSTCGINKIQNMTAFAKRMRNVLNRKMACCHETFFGPSPRPAMKSIT